MERKMRIASLFCGAGGLDIGFHRAGFETVWANDFNGDACDTFRKWCPSAIVECGDIGKIDESELPDDIDVMLGGFPCQGFSLSGPRKLDDKRNSLYRNYVRMVRAKMPKAFIGENVKGLLTMGGGQIVDAIIADFSDCGYEVRYKLLNAKDYGVPEDRQRVIIVGFRKDLGIDDFSYPAEHGHIVTLREALGSVPEPGEGDVSHDAYSSRYMSRNRKRDWDNVSFTIPAMAKQVPLHPSSPDMVKIDSDHWRFGDDGETRRMSWQEAAAIQTFPSDMEFCGNLTSIYKQIGNAVPCNLAYDVAVSVREALERHSAGAGEKMAPIPILE